MLNYSSNSSGKDKVNLFDTAKDVAFKLIANNNWQLHNTTRNFANDICMYACANFDAEWHSADRNGMQIRLCKRMQSRSSPFRESCLADAYHKRDLFDEKKLIFTTKCVASASLVLASLICLDNFVTEQQLASHLFASYFDSAVEQAKKIRHYAYFIFAILCDGCPSRVPSVQNEFASCQNAVFGTSNPKSCNIFQHQGVIAMLQTVSDNRELRRRYSTSWIAKACSILAIFTYTENYFTEIKCRKRHLKHFGDCLIDCALVCQLALRHRDKFITFFNNTFSKETKKRNANGEKKFIIKEQWIQQLFQNWNLGEMFQKRKLGKKYQDGQTLEKKVPWKDVGFVELKVKDSLCVLDENKNSQNIGTGGYGSVSRMQLDNQLVAVKNFISPTDYGPWINDVGDAIQEINALRYLQKTKGFVKIYFAFFKYSNSSQEIQEIQMCMPLYKCDLNTWIKNQQEEKKEKFVFESLAHYASMIVQLANGLFQLHRASFIHRDIKTLNILIKNDDKTVVWSDLGACLYLYNGTAQAQQMRDGATYWWRSPELLIQEGKKPYVTSTASDIWSFGTCIVEMTTGEIPFEVDTNILDRQLEQCSFSLEKRDDDEFGIKHLCMKRKLPLIKKSNLRKQVYSSLREGKQSCVNSKKIANYIFQRLIYLLPSHRDCAQQISEFFAQFTV